MLGEDRADFIRGHMKYTDKQMGAVYTQMMAEAEGDVAKQAYIDKNWIALTTQYLDNKNVPPTPEMPSAPDPNDPFYKNAAGTGTKGDALSQAGAGASQGDAAALNQVTGTPYKSPLGTGGEFSSAASGGTAAAAPDPMDALVGAYQDALRAGTQQTAKLIQNMTQEQSRANAAMQHNAAALNMLVAQSTEAQKQSADVLAKTLAGIGSGNKAAQTQYSATDVSEQMAQTQNDRKRLRASASGTAETKKTGLLAQKALLSQPTLLGS